MSNTPKIAFHGGKCCGVKIIHSLGTNPDATAKALHVPVRSDDVDNADVYGRNVHSATNFFRREAPKETYKERIKRYLDFLDEVRPHGIVEITLAESKSYSFNQLPHWEPLLTEWGFKRVTTCYNSNSCNRVHVFHRTTDKE